MKCKYCDGTGTSNWCINGIFQPCEYCNGTGEVEVVGDSVTDACDKCGGTGFFCEMRMGDGCTLGSPCPHQKPLNNEEWIKSRTTEQLAEWLRGVYWHCHEIDCEHCNYPWRCMEKVDIVEWLKQPHTEKE